MREYDTIDQKIRNTEKKESMNYINFFQYSYWISISNEKLFFFPEKTGSTQRRAKEDEDTTCVPL